MPVLVPAVDHHFDLVMVWDDLGGAVRVRRNGTSKVVDASSGLPVTVTQNGQPTTTVTSDENGHVSFIAPQGIVRLLSGNLSTTEISAEQATAGASSAADAQVAASAAQTAATTATNAAATVTGKADKSKLAFNVKDYGAAGNNSTDDTSAITSAISAAIAAASVGGEVYWPPGSYMVSANIATLHTVRHRGPGRINFSGTYFYMQPTTGQANTLNVSPTGSNSNDGSGPRPMQTLQKAFDTLKNYGPTLGGVWTIVLAAGTYAGAIFPATLTSQETVTIKGPTAGHPNVPTAIIGGGYNVSSYGIQANGVGCSLTVQDILISGYNGSSASAGIQLADTNRELFVVNSHFTDCYWGVSAQTAPYDVKGGIYTRCGFLGDTPNSTTPMSSRNGFGGGTRSLMLSRHSIGTQGAGNLNAGPIFTTCRNGVFAQEGATGHVDWSTITDCETGVYLNSSSRANVDGTSFARNTRDIRAMLSSNAYVTTNTTFGVGIDESSSRVVTSAGGQVIDDNRFFTNVSPVYGHSIRGLETKFPNATVTSTSSTTVYTATLAGGMWRDVVNSVVPRKRVKVSICGELFGTANSKRVTVRLGSASVQLLFVSADVGVFTAEADVFFSDVAAQQMVMRGYRHLGTTTRLARSVGSNPMTADTNLTVEAQVDTAGDSVAIYSVDVSWA